LLCNGLGAGLRPLGNEFLLLNLVGSSAAFRELLRGYSFGFAIAVLGERFAGQQAAAIPREGNLDQR
jgi:hypothetical protein